jgi:hypothetical protein
MGGGGSEQVGGKGKPRVCGGLLSSVGGQSEFAYAWEFRAVPSSKVELRGIPLILVKYGMVNQITAGRWWGTCP